jgi:protocatechuate 4,5-dioxygenase alpha subunit
MALEPPPFDLSAPGSVIYDGRLAALGMRITRFGQSFKVAANREAYRADPEGYLARADLSDEERARIRARDYKWLVQKGGHIQALQRIAVVDGYYLFHIAAAELGVDADELIAACPRRVSGLGGLGGRDG